MPFWLLGSFIIDINAKNKAIEHQNQRIEAINSVASVKTNKIAELRQALELGKGILFSFLAF